MHRFVVAVLVVWSVAAGTVAPPDVAASRNVILVTLDGARTEEIFGGLDAAVFASTLKPEQKLESQPAYERFWAPTPEARREKLMPFFWGTLMKQFGSVAGDPALGSDVHVTNRYR